MQQFFFITVNSILLNLLSCLPFGLQTGFSSFLKLAELSPGWLSDPACNFVFVFVYTDFSLSKKPTRLKTSQFTILCFYILGLVTNILKPFKNKKKVYSV